MSYKIEIKPASKNGYHTPSEAKAYYGRYSRDGVCEHWWNSPDKVKDSDHNSIVNYILGKASRGEGSVNYVLSNKKITLLVNPDNVAWASQSGNPTTVSVEFSPHLDAEGYKKAGWLINELFNKKDGRYRKSPRLWKHSDFFATACPGSLSTSKMLAEAKKWAGGDYDAKPKAKPAPKPEPKPAPKPVKKEEAPVPPEDKPNPPAEPTEDWSKKNHEILVELLMKITDIWGYFNARWQTFRDYLKK
jgi:hypothetical protein